MSKNNLDFKGRGAQKNSANPYSKTEYVQEHMEGIDEELLIDPKTEFFYETPKNIVNKIDSPDLGSMYSMNPYQGCEHGCIYCYARNSHQYWGYSAGIDFERKIIVKKNAAELLEKTFDNPKWKVAPIMLAGNTDCYQPAERKYKITRKVLEVFLKYKHPVSIITKNSLILRDLDLLVQLASLKLVHVSVSITSLEETIRQKLEPRTSTAKNRLHIVESLSNNGIPVNVMVAPIIPGLNNHEIPSIIKAVAEKGASSAAYTIVRLNGSIAEIFTDWVHKSFPDRAEKILHQVADCHNGKLNDSRFGVRMRGDGKISESIASLFAMSKKKYLKDRYMEPFDYSLFKRPEKGQLSLF